MFTAHRSAHHRVSAGLAAGLLALAVQPVTGSAHLTSPAALTLPTAVSASEPVDAPPYPERAEESTELSQPAPVAAPSSSPIDAPAVALVHAQRLDAVGSDPMAPLTSPDTGDHCAAGLSAADLTAFFSEPIGSLQGSDYQRALRLADDRVLWTFQDAFVSGTLVHNVALIQSGRCFTLLNQGARSWLFADITVHMDRWHWILDGTQEPDGTIHLFVAEMHEQGGGYLERTTPVALRRVALHGESLEVIDITAETPTSTDLYGWSITSDGTHTYLYSHCYRQFGFDGLLGIDGCAEHVKVARVRVGDIDGPREYWSLDGWVTDSDRANPVVDAGFVGSGNNPAQIRFDRGRFVLVEKQDDWWGTTVAFGVAEEPQGPFRAVASVEETLKCEQWGCNTYFSAWIPWRDPSGALIWSISHNRWDGAETASHLHVYRPTFQTIEL